MFSPRLNFCGRKSSNQLFILMHFPIRTAFCNVFIDLKLKWKQKTFWLSLFINRKRKMFLFSSKFHGKASLQKHWQKVHSKRFCLFKVLWWNELTIEIVSNGFYYSLIRCDLLTEFGSSTLKLSTTNLIFFLNSIWLCKILISELKYKLCKHQCLPVGCLFVAMQTIWLNFSFRFASLATWTTKSFPINRKLSVACDDVNACESVILN